MKRDVIAIAMIALVAGFAAQGALAQQEHHGGAGPEAAVPEGSQQQAPGGSGKGMMGGMMHGMMGHGGMGMMGHGGAPAVVINIYPGGGMSMMGPGMGGMMGRGMGMMGQGGMGMMGGMMGSGQGMGMMGPAGEGTDRNLSADDVRQGMGAHMSRMGGGLELGAVRELDDDLVDVEVTDQAGGPARRIIINRHTGAMMRVR